MKKPFCPGCLQRDETIITLRQRLAALESRVRDLEGQLGRNAINSSVPPSANPLGAPKPSVKKSTGRPTGGQPGHPAHLRRRLPLERVQRIRDFIPQQCQRCQEPLAHAAAANDPEPTWHQVAELPKMAAEITEYRGHFRTCPGCGTLNHATIPANIKAYCVGPRLAATLSYLTGRHHLSQRGLEELAEDVFEVPLSLGTVGHLAQQMSVALAPAHAEALQEVRAAAVKNVDETSWKLAGAGCWLWAAATSTAAAFVIHPRTKFLTSLHIYLNADGRKKYGRRKFQFQFVNLESDDPECGFADDGTWFAVTFSGAARQRLIVRGRSLEAGYDFLTFHRMPWVRAAERDFGQEAEEPIITSIEIVKVEEEKT